MAVVHPAPIVISRGRSSIVLESARILQSVVSYLLMVSQQSTPELSHRLADLGHIDEEACRRFQSTVEFAGRKWNAAILLAGVRGARRFSEYREAVTGISDRLLAAQRDVEIAVRRTFYASYERGSIFAAGNFSG